MSEAEEKALKAYPPIEGETDEVRYLRDGYMNGYERSEKDHELTWADMMFVHEAILLSSRERKNSKEYYEEVLETFKMLKNDDKGRKYGKRIISR